jgi:hemerythrin-like metal-binding protein
VAKEDEMPVVTWDEKYSVRVPEIDAQHKRLFDLIDGLSEAITDKKTPEGMKKILNGLVQYTEFHFQYEERLMERFRYPGLDAQRAAHRAFVQKVGGFQDGFSEGTLLPGAEVIDFLTSQLVEHILAFDMKYADCLTGKVSLMEPLSWL